MLIYGACALGGRNNLFDIFENWLSLMGYWCIIYITIVIEEHYLFHGRGNPYDWAAWNDRSKLPVGYAAFAAFLIGWAGAVIGMDQVYFVGPIA